jgi:hypothetical protein
VARFVCFGGFYKVVGKKGRNTQGYGVKIMKVNENNDLANRTLQRIKAK